MKISCDIINDLLPLYAENMVSTDSKKLVNEHLANCERCRHAYSEMRENVELPRNTDTSSLKVLSKKLLRGRVIAAILVLLIITGLLMSVWYVGTSECVVRVSFTGVNNMFHVPYEYYAIHGTAVVRIPGWLARLACPPAVSDSIYDDMDTSHWYGELIYAQEHSRFSDDYYSYEETDFGEDYRLKYSNWTSNTDNPEDEDVEIMRRAAQTLHSGDIEDWTSYGDGITGLTWFRFVRHGEQFLAAREGKFLYLAMEDGTFHMLMECPQNGQFDYFYFP